MRLLFKFVNGFINCPENVDSINFNVTQYRTRSTSMFYIFTHRTNYALESSINRIMSIANEHEIELFNFNSIKAFNNYVKIIFVFKYLCYCNLLILLLLLLFPKYLYFYMNC